MHKIILRVLIGGYIIANVSCDAKTMRRVGTMDGRTYQERLDEQRKADEINRSNAAKKENERAIREFNEKVNGKMPYNDTIQN